MRYDNLSVDASLSIQSLLVKMNDTLQRLFLVYDKQDFIGIISIGDVQRAILKKVSFNMAISKIMRPFEEQRFASPTTSPEEIKKLMIEFRMEILPVVDSERNLVEVYMWDELFSGKKHLKQQIGIPVVIMAGGFGNRMKPLTNVIPKPLIPISDKPIVHEIMDRFAEYGCLDFHLSVSYKAHMIKAYFDDLEDCSYNLNYYKEESPTGTAGSLCFMKENLRNSPFFISNCDITIDEDYYQIYDYHKKNKNELTLVAAMKNYPVPYGVVETKEGGELEIITEKPEFMFQINTGFYVLEPHLLDEIPEDSFFHITHLMEKIKSRKGKIGVFPVNESAWHDIGNWDEYIQTLKVFK